MSPNPNSVTEPNGIHSPPSSFSGIWKYPTDRETPFRINEDWLRAKQKDDNIGNYWRVYDKLYNLDEFLEKHPGGPEWIRLTRGTDITEAFEASHIIHINYVEQTLAKYFICEAKEPRISPYTFRQDGFYKTVKRRIAPVLEKYGTGPTWKIRAFMDFLFTAFMTFMIAGCYFESFILKVFAGLFCTFSLNAGHNFMHQKNNWRKYYADLGLMASHEWLISHTLSHHLYPNTVMDLEVTALEPVFEFFPLHPKSSMQKYGPILYAHIMYGLYLWVDFVKRFVYIFTGKQKFRPENLIVILELLICCAVSPSKEDGLKSWCIIHTVTSCVFQSIGVHAAHHHPDVFHDGDEPRPEPDFGLCQLDATVTKSDLPFKNLYIILSTFGDHTIHHLFPTVCHSKLHLIKPILNETLKEFSEAIPEMSHWELYRGAYRQLQRTEAKKLKSK